MIRFFFGIIFTVLSYFNVTFQIATDFLQWCALWFNVFTHILFLPDVFTVVTAALVLEGGLFALHQILTLRSWLGGRKHQM